MSELGRHDPFRDVCSWEEETAKAWASALEERAAAVDQVALRATLRELAGVEAGDYVVEIGCGTGALLVELAGLVGAGGRVLGLEPQPYLAEVASAKVRAASLDQAAVITAGVEDLLLRVESADACFAQTVLPHLLPEVARWAIVAMAAAVRPGGRVASADQDGDTWVVDHPYRELTRRIIAFNSDQRCADGWTGRRLRALFADAGLSDLEIATHVVVEDQPGYLYAMCTRIAVSATDAGVLSNDQATRWLAALQGLAERDRFFSSVTYFVCAGRRTEAPVSCAISGFQTAPL